MNTLHQWWSNGGNNGALRRLCWVLASVFYQESFVTAQLQLLEALRVSFFARELRTPQPVSIKRLEKAWGQLNH
jgi:hypothetical protein